MNAYAQQHYIEQSKCSNRCSSCTNSAAYWNKRSNMRVLCVLCMLLSLSLPPSIFRALAHSYTRFRMEWTMKIKYMRTYHWNSTYFHVNWKWCWWFSAELCVCVCVCRLLIVASVYTLLAFHLCDALHCTAHTPASAVRICVCISLSLFLSPRSSYCPSLFWFSQLLHQKPIQLSNFATDSLRIFFSFVGQELRFELTSNVSNACVHVHFRLNFYRFEMCACWMHL